MIRKRSNLRPLAEGSQVLDIVEMLTQSAVADSATVLIKAAAILSTEFTKAMLARTPQEKLTLLEKTLADTRAMRTAASKIPDDTVTDYVWTAVTAWWKVALKYGVSAATDPEGVNSATRNSTLKKFDILIKFLKVEIARTKLEAAQQKSHAAT